MKKMILCIVLLGLFISCGDKKSGKTAKDKPKERKITLLVAPWYDYSDEFLAGFTKETGIKVEVENLAWDDLKNKVVTSLSAGGSPADVTQFMSDWVATLGKDGKFVDLSTYLDDATKKDMANLPLFSYDGRLFGMPTDNDFRLTYINKTKFEKAGLEAPKTIEDLATSLEKLNKTEKGSLMVPFSATEGSSTPWFLMTKAYGGDLFDKDWNPLFAEKGSAGYKAMTFLINSYKKGLVDKNSITYTGSDVVQNFKNGKGAVDLAGWSSNINGYTADDSKIKDDVEAILVPGINGTHRTFSLAESFGVPANSKHKEDAVKFLLWLNKKETVEKNYLERGTFPNRISVIEKLSKENKIPFGDTIAKSLPMIETLYVNPEPAWSSEFITETVTLMNQMAKGTITVDAGLKELADYTNKLKDEK